MKLYVDDKRPFPQSGYECCRDVETAKLFLSLMPFEVVSLDYNLGDGRTGLEILEYMHQRGIQVSRINIHSDNTKGIAEMSAYCVAHFPNAEVTFRSA